MPSGANPTEYTWRCMALTAPFVVCGLPARLVDPPEGWVADAIPLCLQHEEEEAVYRLSQRKEVTG